MGERELLDVLRPEAERYDPKLVLIYKDASHGERERIERRMVALDAKLDARRLDGPAYKTAIAAPQGELARLGHADRTVDKLRGTYAPSWDDVPAMNGHLRRIWTAVRLDADMTPTVEWAIPMQDAETNEADNEALNG